MTKNKNDKSLYAVVILLLGSVGGLAAIAYFLWLPNLIHEFYQAPPYILEMLKSAALYTYIPFVLWCFILGEATMNLSQVDKIWSLSPPTFCWYITWYDAKEHDMTFNYKLVYMSCLVSIWGARLTYQFYKKGGYSIRFWTGEEDYRWETVRRRLPILNNRFVFFLFDLGFICVYQLLLLFTISAVVMVATIMVDKAAELPRDSLTTIDLIKGSIMLLLIYLETVSDSHQQVFQLEKYRRIREKIPLECSTNHYESGFNTNGLFAYSRHPNFIAEQLIWVVFYLFSVTHFADLKTCFNLGGPFNAASIGAVLLIVLFLKSTDLTEDISAAKYPLYVKYQRNVARFFDVGAVFRKLFLGQNPNRDWLIK
uniref:Uncharacterized protein n=1 Tax=Clytia hemisphaerica TaxID=252671 RepID=A0A7M5VF77_9CNID